MSTIASLAVLLKGGTGHFSKSMKRGRRDLGTFRTAALSVRRTVRTMGIAIAGAAVAGGVALAAMTRRSMATVDSTAKLSDVLGISTEELVRLRHAADLSGISSQELDKGLVKFAKSLGEAKAGVITYADSFRMLGLSQRDIQGMDTPAALRATADALKDVPDRSQRAMLAMRLFGRSGAPMVKMLEDGAAGLERMGKRAGSVFSRADAARVERANDALTDLKRTAASLSQRMAVAVAPAVEAAGEALQHLPTAAAEVGTALADLAGGPGGIKPIQDLTWAIDLFGFGLKNAGLTIDWLAAEAELGFATMKGAIVDVGTTLQATLGKKGIGGVYADLRKANAAFLFADIDKARELWRDYFGGGPTGDLYRNLREGRAGDMSGVAELEAAKDKLRAARGKLGTAYKNHFAALYAQRAQAEAAARRKAAAGSPTGLSGVNFEAVEAGDNALTRLQRQLHALRHDLGPEGIQILDLRALGVAESQLRRVWTTSQQIKRLQEERAGAADAAALGQSIRDRHRTPAEALAKEAAEVQRALAAGTISEELASRAFADIRRRAGEQLGGVAAPGGGSAALASRFLTHRALPGAKAADSALAQAKEQTTLLAGILRWLERIHDDGGLA